MDSKNLGDDIGLFGVVNSNAEFTNLRVVNIHVEGNETVGGLAGRLYQAGVVVENIHIDGTVIGSGQAVGGIIGQSAGTNMSELHFVGDVSTGSSMVGGIIGSMSSCSASQYVDSASFKGNITAGTLKAGGIIGLSTCALRNAFVEESSVISGAGETGGLIGILRINKLVDSISHAAVSASGSGFCGWGNW